MICLWLFIKVVVNVDLFGVCDTKKGSVSCLLGFKSYIVG